MTKQFSNYSDLITFTRASGGHALRPVSYGDELVTNHDFSDGSTGWTVQNTDATHTVTFSNGGARFQSDTTSPILEIVSDVVLDSTKIYKLEVVISDVTSGSIKIDGQSVVQLYNSEGTHTAIIKTTSASGNNVIKFYRATANVDITIDSVSVKEVTFDESDGTLTLFEHPDNIPRVEYDADGNRLGLLVEEARTNLVTYSEDLSLLTKVNSPTITTDIATAPDGTETVDGIQDASGGAFRRVKMFQGSVTANSTHTGSLFVKKETSATSYGGVTLNFTGGTSKVCYGIIDAVNGTINAPSSGNTITATFTTTEVGDFWRFSITATDTGSNTQLEFGVYGTLSTDGTTVGSGAGSVRRIWGAQLEAGSFPTSYIKTTGSTATRSADVASIPVADFGYNQKALTVSIEASHLYDTFPAFNRFWELSGGGDLLGLYGSSGSSSYVNLTVGGVQQVNFGDGSEAAADANTFMKYAVGLKTNDFDIARDGSLDVGDTSIIMSDAMDTLTVGSDLNGSSQLNGHIKSIKYYPRRLTNAQLVDLTS